MKVLIIEDEQVTANNLARMLHKYQEDIEVLAILNSVSAAINYLANQQLPDVIFLDIQLGDGLSFEIFEEVEVTTPVIFTTAYDEYLQKAFELNSIDYLLKPISFGRLSKSLEKFQKLYNLANQEEPSTTFDYKKLEEMISWKKATYKSRFLVKMGKQLRVVAAQDIAYFVKDGVVLLVDKDGNKYALNESLEELSKSLNPTQFFRVNRQYLIQMTSIEEIYQENQQINLYLNPSPLTQTLVSQRNVPAFKKWLEEG